MLKGIAAAMLLVASFAQAGEIRLWSGSLTFEDLNVGDATVHLVGNHGFTFEGEALSAFLQAAECAYECDIGEKYSVGMVVSGNDLPGVATMGERDYADVGGLSSLNTMVLTFSGETRVPRGKLPRTQTVQVKVGGVFEHEGPGVPYPTVTETLSGKGMAIVTWVQYEESGDRVIGRLRYVIGR
jgi:hypothetical protein